MKNNFYSAEKISSALDVLVRNQYNYAKTSRDTGISVTTLRRWNTLYGASRKDTAPKTEPVTDKEFNDLIRSRVAKYFKDCENLMRLLIKRAEELVARTNDLRSIVYAINTLLTAQSKFYDKKFKGQPGASTSGIYDEIMGLSEKRVREMEESGEWGDLDNLMKERMN